MFSLICVWINGWVNNREAGHLRRHRGHYDVNVMWHGLLVSIFLCTKLVEDVKLTRYSVCDALTTLKIAVINAKKPGYPCQMSNESTWFQGKCTLFYSCFGNYRRLAYKISAYEVCVICPKLFVACKIHCKSPSRQPDGLTTLDRFTVHEANLTAYVRESAYVRSHVGCERVHQTLLLHVPQIFQRRKMMQINRILQLS